MSIAGKRVILIGGAGFIGHHLAIELVRRGCQVEIIDGLQVNNLVSVSTDWSNADNRELNIRIVYQRLQLLREAGVTLHVQDARDYAHVSSIIDRAKPDAIVHLAAVAHAGRSNKDPFSTFDHSLRTLENALDAARDNAGHFVFFSSSMVYGNFLTEQVAEDHPLNPMGIYGALKVAGEKVVIAYQQVFDLPYTIIRPSALYGPRCVSRRVGQIFIENAMRGHRVRVDGDGSEKLDFTYIDDLVAGVCQVLETPAARNEIFNLTYGESRSLKELLDITRRHFPDVEIESVERDKLMPVRGTLSVEKAKRLLGYAPKFPIDVGFPRYIEWYKSMQAGDKAMAGSAV
jgi:nucleoside-diphosphate-sugar epimerase